MKNICKGFGLVLCITIMLISMAIPEKVKAATGTWSIGATASDSITAVLTDDGAFTVSGTGAMKNFGALTMDSPWRGLYKTEIKSVVIEEGVTSIGDYFLEGMTATTNIKISNTVTSIGRCAFRYTSITSLDIPSSVKNIAENALSDAYTLSNIYVYTTDAVVASNIISPLSFGNITLHGYIGSTIQTYASTNGIKFMELKSLSSVPEIKRVANEYSVLARNTLIWECSMGNASSLSLEVEGIEVDSNDWQLKDGKLVWKASNMLSSFEDGNYEISFKFDDDVGTIITDTIIVYHGIPTNYEAKYDMGETKNSITGYLLSDGTLYLHGTGMTLSNTESSYSSSAWFKDIIKINRIVVGEGITHLGNCVFYSLAQLKEVELPSTLVGIGTKAFANCRKLSDIQRNLGNGPVRIGSDAFYNTVVEIYSEDRNWVARPLSTCNYNLVYKNTLGKVFKTEECINYTGFYAEYIGTNIEEVRLDSDLFGGFRVRVLACNLSAINKLIIGKDVSSMPLLGIEWSGSISGKYTNLWKTNINTLVLLNENYTLDFPVVPSDEAYYIWDIDDIYVTGKVSADFFINTSTIAHGYKNSTLQALCALSNRPRVFLEMTEQELNDIIGIPTPTLTPVPTLTPTPTPTPSLAPVPVTLTVTADTSKPVNTGISASIAATGDLDYIIMPNGVVTSESEFEYYFSRNGDFTFTAVGLNDSRVSQTVSIRCIDTKNPELIVNSVMDEDKVVYTVNAFDGESGIDYILLPDGRKESNLPITYSVDTFGDTTFVAADKAGNMVTKTFTRQVITTGGTSTFLAYEGIPLSWTNRSAEIKLAALNQEKDIKLGYAFTSNTGVISSNFGVLAATGDSFRLVRTVGELIAENITLKENGTLMVSVSGSEGDIGEVPVVIRYIDTEAPIVTSTVSNNVITIEATDALSGVATIVSPDGSLSSTYTAKYNGVYRFLVYDIAGNVTKHDVTVTGLLEPDVPIIPEADEEVPPFNGALTIKGIVKPEGSTSDGVTVIDVDVPINLTFTVNGDRTISFSNAQIISRTEAPLVVKFLEVMPSSNAPTVVSKEFFDDWENLTEEETRSNLAMSINNVDLSEGAGILGVIPSAITETQYLPLTLDVVCGTAWGNSDTLNFYYTAMLEIEIAE